MLKKRLLVTQRECFDTKTNEIRDCLDKRWYDFLLACDVDPIFVPNSPNMLRSILKKKFSGILLTGGNDLIKYGGQAPDRDKIEYDLIQHAVINSIPIIGVCRGMQIIQDYFGTELVLVTGHVGVRHKLKVIDSCNLSKILLKFNTVNSFHNYGHIMNSCYKQSNDLSNLAVTDNGVVMAIKHKHLPMFGQMWHCEREIDLCKFDIDIFRYMLFQINRVNNID